MSRPIAEPQDGERDGFSAQEIARRWGVSESTIYALQDQGTWYAVAP